MKSINLVIFTFLISFNSFAQCTFDLQWETPYEGFVSPLSLEADILDRPYLYVASNEYGLRIFHTDGSLVTDLDTSHFGMSVMNFTQSGSLLYLALGNHFNEDPPGMAIVDVSDPSNPAVVDIWVHPNSGDSNGSGIVKVEGNLAYLGAMRKGLIILDISDAENISMLSELPLDINYPFPNPNPNFYNARGLAIKDGIAYVAFDAGGLRIIDCSNPSAPAEVARFANPITFANGNQPRAYNNVLLNDSLVYIAVDYCGIEVVKINDWDNLTMLEHYNPHDCPSGSWFNAPLHANEMKYVASCEKLLVSVGRGEMEVLDVSNPEMVEYCGGYGSIDDTTATWGIGMRNDSIFLSYLIIPIYIPFIHPFDAKWNGIKMIKWDDSCINTTNVTKLASSILIKVAPNPSWGHFNLDLDQAQNGELQVWNSLGQLLQKQSFFQQKNLTINIDGPQGLYFVTVTINEQETTLKLVKH